MSKRPGARLGWLAGGHVLIAHRENELPGRDALESRPQPERGVPRRTRDRVIGPEDGAAPDVGRCDDDERHVRSERGLDGDFGDP